MMEPDKVKTVFICGQERSNKLLLFKFAIDWSENGCNVLYISNIPISSIPDTLQDQLVKDTLKRIIFMYFNETKDLLVQCAELNKSSFVPQLIIIDALDQFCKLTEAEVDFNMQQAAFICAALLSSTAICAKRTNKDCYLIVACDNKQDNEDYTKRMKLLSDLYFFKHIWLINEHCELQNVFEQVVELRQKGLNFSSFGV